MSLAYCRFDEHRYKLVQNTPASRSKSIGLDLPPDFTGTKPLQVQRLLASGHDRSIALENRKERQAALDTFDVHGLALHPIIADAKTGQAKSPRHAGGFSWFCQTIARNQAIAGAPGFMMANSSRICDSENRWA